VTEVQVVAEVIGKRKCANHKRRLQRLWPITAMERADPVLKQMKLRVSGQISREPNGPFQVQEQWDSGV